MIDADGRRAAELIGRTEEAERIARALSAAESDCAPVVIQIEGDAGIGKSTLLRSALDKARERGWIVVAATCRPAQSEIPLAAAQQLLRSLLEALDENRERYAKGLDVLLDSADSSEKSAKALQRLAEGVTLDHPLLLSLDDAQWADADTLKAVQALVVANPQRRLAMVVATRPERDPGALTPNVSIALEPLANAQATAVARQVLPDAAEPVLEAIVRHSRGYPLDIIAIAKGLTGKDVSVDEVASSRRAIIARDVREAQPDLREFLQVCSLVDGPIEYALLEKLWPDRNTLDNLIARAAGRYVIAEGPGIAFVHALIADGIRETIAIPAPYRRRLIEALRRIERPSPEESETLAALLAANGDKAGAFATLAALAAAAAHRGQIRLTASASSRALQFFVPDPEQAGSFFTDYADALFALDRDEEAIAVLETALRLLHESGAALPGAAVARLILAQCFSDQLSTAEATYQRFLGLVAGDGDRANLYSAAMWFGIARCSLEEVEARERDILAVAGDLSLHVRLRMRNFKAFALALAGRHAEAMEKLDEAAAIVNEVTLLGHTGISRDQALLPRIFVGLWEFGTRVLEQLIHRRRNAQVLSEGTPADFYFLTMRDVLGGEWDQAEATIAGVMDRDALPTARRRVLTFAALISALQQQPSPYEALIEDDVAQFLAGRHEGWFLPIATWWAARAASRDPKAAKAILSVALEKVGRPSDPHVYLPSLAVVMIADRLKDEAALRLLSAHRVWAPKTHWHLTQAALTKALASTLLGSKNDVALREVAAQCRELGLNVFADIAAGLTQKAEDGSLARLDRLGVVWPERTKAAQSKKASFLKPTAREMQVVGLVAQGNTNQEIADNLVLSQRTVEAHIANLFNKVGVSSRTQLTAWFLKNS